MVQARSCLLLALVVSLLFVSSETASGQLIKKSDLKKKQAAERKKSSRKPSSSSRKKSSARKKKKKPTPKPPRLPPLKTPADKKRFLEYIRRSFPSIRRVKPIAYSSGNLDQALETQRKLSERDYAPLISDETFVRRVYLDLTGNVPKSGEVRQFVANAASGKRAKLIDRLLESPEYGRKWGRYWRVAIFHDSDANKKRVNEQALEDWLAGEFQKNTSWDRIVAELISATPVRSKSDKKDFGQNYGPNNLILAYENKPKELASQTSKLFMGIRIDCAECHDHPFDRWKREQFHEMAAFFSRGKYYMEGQYDPTEKEVMQPRFLLGEKPPLGIDVDARRVAVAAYLVYNPDNYWFARSYVNRIWSELIGDGFYSVDSLGPDGEVVMKLLVNRLAYMFRNHGFDTKWLIRLIMNSKAYQREIRAVESEERLFTQVRPSRLRFDQVKSSIENVAGTDKNVNAAVERTFKVDPSIPQKSLEGTVQQVLLMMNNGSLQNRLRSGPLKKRLAGIRSNEALVGELYLGVLSRKPTAGETERSLNYLKDVGNRNEAIDDLIWVLVNSTEFLTKR